MKTIKIIAYVIIFYVAAFVIWWMVLLTKVENQKFDLQVSYAERTEQTTSIPALKDKHESNKRQILYEGIVFLILLGGSSLYIIRGLRKQQRFAILKRNFLLATSHELKTPLATTKLNLQSLAKQSFSPEVEQKLVSNSLQEVDRLNQLIDNVLLASKLDAPDYQFSVEPIQLKRFMLEVVTQHPEKERIELDIDHNKSVAADRAALRIIINNLIGNALKYSEANELVKVSSPIPINNIIEVAIIDTGIGIDPKEYKYIFERFYRAGDERTRNTTGTGLGLFLVKEMTTQLKGSISVAANNPQGSIFTLKLTCVDE